MEKSVLSNISQDYLVSQYRLAFFSTQDCVFEYYPGQEQFYAPADNWRAMFHFVPIDYNDIIYRLCDMITPKDRSAFRNIFSLGSLFRGAAGRQNYIRHTFPFLLDDVCFSATFTVVPIVEGDRLVCLLGCISKMNPENPATQNTALTNMTDRITGLLNRSQGEAAITAYLSGRESAGSCAFILIDIDNFRTINDTLGHPFGDYVLKSIAQKLDSFFGEEAIILRFGGDEFVVFLKEYGADAELVRKLEALCHALNHELFQDDNRLAVDLAESFGVSTCPEHGTNFRELYITADQALRQAKKQKDCNYTIYHA